MHNTSILDLAKILLFTAVLMMLTACQTANVVLTPVAKEIPATRQPFPDISRITDLTRVTSIQISDSYQTFYRLRFAAQYTPRPKPDSFEGTAEFSVKYEDRPEVTASEQLVIPLSIIESFLRAISRLSSVSRTSRPDVTPTDSTGNRTVNVRTADWTLSFGNSGKLYYVHDGISEQGMIDPSAPNDVIYILSPYLKADIRENLINAAQRP